MTARVGLIGHPLTHSISPRFQQAAFDALGIDARYQAWDIEPEEAAARHRGLAASRRAGGQCHHSL